jgi:bifunctional DNase/RNase
MVEVHVSRIGYDPGIKSYVIVLQETGGDRLLPIWVGQSEAAAIITQVNQIQHRRPSTHDLCRLIIAGLGCTLYRVRITHLEYDTYFGELVLAREDGKRVRVDSRPSDAIAIALRLDAPILVEEVLLMEAEEGEAIVNPPPPSNAGKGSDPAADDAPELSAEQLKEYLERLRPEDFGKFEL